MIKEDEFRNTNSRLDQGERIFNNVLVINKRKVSTKRA